MRSLSKKRQKIAANLLHLLYLNKLQYSSDWETWIGYVIGTDDEWTSIGYSQLVDIAALIVSGITMERADIDETKILLQQIERWVTQSNGNLVRLQETKTRTKWYPVCLVDPEIRELVKK